MDVAAPVPTPVDFVPSCQRPPDSTAWSQIRRNWPDVVLVLGKKDHSDLTVVHRHISTCSVAEELKKSGSWY